MLKTDKTSTMNIRRRKIQMPSSITASGRGQEAEATLKLPEHTKHQQNEGDWTRTPNCDYHGENPCAFTESIWWKTTKEFMTIK